MSNNANASSKAAFWRDVLGLAAMVLPLVAAALLTWTPIREPDLFMYLAMAQRYWTLGAMPAIDPFIHSRAQAPFLGMHEWLGALWFGLLQQGGIDFVVHVTSLCVVLICSLPLFWLWPARHSSSTASGLLILALGIYAASIRFLPRTALLGEMCALSLLFILLQARRGSKLWLLLPPPLFALWVNLHPSFPIGLVFFILAALCLQPLPMAWILSLVASGAALFVHPDGWHGVVFPLGFGASISPSLKSQVLEWYPPYHPLLRQVLELKFFAAEVVVFVLFFLTQLRRRPYFEGLVALVLLSLALWAIRFVALSALGLALLAASMCQANDKPVRAALPEWIKGGVALAALMLVVALVLGVNPGRLRPHRLGTGIDQDFFSPKAITWLEQQALPGRIFNSWEQGGYLAWRWNGRIPIFIHGFTVDWELKNQAYDAIGLNPAEFERVVREYALGVFILGKALPRRDLLKQLEARQDWELVYEDQAVWILFRKP